MATAVMGHAVMGHAVLGQTGGVPGPEPEPEPEPVAPVRTAADVIFETRRLIRSGVNPALNWLTADVTASATALAFEDPLGAIQPGAILSIGLERFYVRSIEETGPQSVTVSRGFDGTIPAAHEAGDLVRVNDHFDDFAILEEINHELAALSSPSAGLFQMRSADLTYDSAVRGYDLAGVERLLSVYELRYQLAGAVDDYWRRIARWELARHMPTADFPSGSVLFVREGSHQQTIRVRYRAAFGTLSLLDDDVETAAGLHEEAHDILALGAASRLAAAGEVKRNFTEQQGDSRRAEEVPPGAVHNSSRGLRQIRDGRVREEATRLKQLYPQVSL